MTSPCSRRSPSRLGADSRTLAFSAGTDVVGAIVTVPQSEAQPSSTGNEEEAGAAAGEGRTLDL